MSEEKNTPEETQATEESDVAVATEENKEEEEVKIAYELGEIEDLPESVKRIHFTVPWEEYDKKSLEIIQDLQKNAEVPGFRKGKAPKRLVRARYGKQVNDECLEFMLVNGMQQIVEEKGIEVYDRSNDDIPEIVDGQPFKFATSLEVKPEIDATGYDSFDVEVEEKPVNDDSVKEQIERIREANASMETKEGAIKKDDGASITTVVNDEKGKAIDALTMNEYTMQDLSNLPEDVYKALIGKKAGETVEIESEEAHGDHKHTRSWSVTINEVKQRKLPELDDEFAKDVGAFESLKDLEDRIRKDMEQVEEDSIRNQSLEQINKQLVERNEFAVPPSLKNAAQYQFAQRDYERMRTYGPPADYNPETYRDTLSANAEEYLRASLLHEAIADKEKIEATDDDVDKELQKRADTAGRKPLAIRAGLEAEGKWDGFKDDLKLQSVADFLIGKAKVKKVAAKDKKDDK